MEFNPQYLKGLEDLEIDTSDMLSDPKAFIARCVKKSKEMAAQLDARSTLGDNEKNFKEKALKDTEAKETAKELYDNIYTLIADQTAEVQVNLLSMMPELLSMMNNSVRSMSMRTGKVTTLSKRQISLLYGKLKSTYETYVNFMKLFAADEIGMPPVIPVKKGNYADHSITMGIKTYEFILNGVSYYNPYPVAFKLGIDVVHYMDLPLKIMELQAANPDGEINGYKVELKDISKVKDDEE